MTFITWFDPGESTGIVMGHFSDFTPYEHRRAYQIPGGVQALMDFIAEDNEAQWWLPTCEIIGCEKFIPREIEGGSHTLESTLPLVLEGLLMARGLMPVYPEGNWQPATAQLLSGGDTPEERKANSDNLLRAAGLWFTGEDVGRPDANDVNSATKHIVHFLTRKLRHRPTIEAIYGRESS